MLVGYPILFQSEFPGKILRNEKQYFKLLPNILLCIYMLRTISSKAPLNLNSYCRTNHYTKYQQPNVNDVVNIVLTGI